MSIFNRTIGARLNSGFFIVLLILLALAVISYTSQRATIWSIKIDIAAGQARLGIAQELRESMLRSGSYIRDVGLNTDVAPMNVAIKSFERESKRYDELFAQLSRQVGDVEGKQLLAKINDARLMAMPHAREAIGLATIFNTEMAVKLLTDKLSPAQVKWSEAIESFVAREEVTYKAAVVSSITRGERANAAVLGFAMLAVVIALIVAWWLRRSITVPLIHAVKLARAVATKDLTVQVDFQSDDEAGQLLDAMRAMCTPQIVMSDFPQLEMSYFWS